MKISQERCLARACSKPWSFNKVFGRVFFSRAMLLDAGSKMDCNRVVSYSPEVVLFSGLASNGHKVH